MRCRWHSSAFNRICSEFSRLTFSSIFPKYFSATFPSSSSRPRPRLRGPAIDAQHGLCALAAVARIDICQHRGVRLRRVVRAGVLHQSVTGRSERPAPSGQRPVRVSRGESKARGQPASLPPGNAGHGKAWCSSFGVPPGASGDTLQPLEGPMPNDRNTAPGARIRPAAAADDARAGARRSTRAKVLMQRKDREQAQVAGRR